MALTAQLNLDGKNNISKIIADANKDLKLFQNTAESTGKSFLSINTKADSTASALEKVASSYRSIGSAASTTKNTYKDTLSLSKGIMTISEGVDTATSGFAGLGLKLVGVQSQFKGLGDFIGPTADGLREIAEAEGGVEKGFAILDQVSKPLAKSLTFLGKKAEQGGKLFKELEVGAAKLGTTFTGLSSKAIEKFNDALKDIQTNLKSTGGLFNKFASKQLEGVIESFDKTSEKLGKIKIDPKELKNIDTFGEEASKRLVGLGKKLEKAGVAVRLTDFVGDIFRAGKSVQKFVTEDGADLVEGLGSTKDLFTSSGLASKVMADKIGFAATVSAKLAEVLQNQMLGSLSQVLTKFLFFKTVTSTLSKLSEGTVEAYLELNNLSDAMGVMTKLGFDDSILKTVTSLGLLGEQLILNSEKAREFGQAAVAAFAQLQDQAAFVTTLSSGRQFQFEDAKAGVDSVSSALSNLVNKDLKNAITSTSAATSLYNALSASVGKVAGGATDAGESMKFLSAALKLSSATGADNAQTVEALAKVGKVYNLSNKEAALTAAKLNAVVENGIIQFPQLAGGIGRVSTVAQANGIQLNELLGTISALTNVMSADDAMTGYASLLNAISGQGAESSKAVQELGIRFDAQTVRTKGLVTSLTELRDATGGNIEKLKTIIPDSLALTTALTLMGSASNLAKTNIEEMGKVGSNSLDQLFEARRASTITRVRELMNGFNEILIDFGQRAAPIIEPGLKVLEGFLNFLQELPGPIKAAIGGLILFQSTMGSIIGAVSGFVGSIAKIALALVARNLIQTTLQGNLLKEKDILIQLVSVQGNYGEALARLIGLKKNYDKASVDLSKSLQKQVEVSTKLENTLGESFLQTNNVKTFKNEIDRVSQEISNLKKNTGFAAADPLGFNARLRELRTLRTELKKSQKEIGVSQISSAGGLRRASQPVLQDNNTPVEQKAKAILDSYEKSFGAFEKKTRDEVAKVAKEMDAILADSSLSFEAKVKAFQKTSQSLYKTAPKANLALISQINKEFELVTNRLSEIPVEYGGRVKSAVDSLFSKLPDSVKGSQAGEKLKQELTLALSDLDKPIAERKQALLTGVGEIFSQLPKELQAQEPKIQAALSKLLDPRSAGNFAEKNLAFSRELKKVYKEIPVELQYLLGNLQGDITLLARNLEAPFQGVLSQPSRLLKEASKQFKTLSEDLKSEQPKILASFEQSIGKLSNNGGAVKAVYGQIAKLHKLEGDELINEIEAIQKKVSTTFSDVANSEEGQNFSKLIEGIKKKALAAKQSDLAVSVLQGNEVLQEAVTKSKTQLISNFESIKQEAEKTNLAQIFKESVKTKDLERVLADTTLTVEQKFEKLSKAAKKGLDPNAAKAQFQAFTVAVKDFSKGVENNLEVDKITAKIQRLEKELERFADNPKIQSKILKQINKAETQKATLAGTKEAQTAARVMGVTSKETIVEVTEVAKQSQAKVTNFARNSANAVSDGLGALAGFVPAFQGPLFALQGFLDNSLLLTNAIGEGVKETEDLITSNKKLATSADGATKSFARFGKELKTSVLSGDIVSGLSLINEFFQQDTAKFIKDEVGNRKALRKKTAEGISSGVAEVATTGILSKLGPALKSPTKLIANLGKSFAGLASTVGGFFGKLVTGARAFTPLLGTIGTVLGVVTSLVAGFLLVKTAILDNIPGINKLTSSYVRFNDELTKTLDNVDKANKKRLGFDVGVDPKTELKDWRAFFLNIGEGATNLALKVAAFIKKLNPFRGLFKISKDDINTELEQSQKGVRKFFNGLRENIQAGLESRFRDNLEKLAGEANKVVDDTLAARGKQNQGFFSNPQARAIEDKARKERRALTAKELEDAVALERKALTDKQKIISEEIATREKLKEKAPSENAKKAIQKQIDDLTAEASAYEKSTAALEKYQRQLNETLTQLEFSDAGKSQQKTIANFNRIYQNLPKEARKAYAELLGLQTKTVETQNGTIEEVVGTTLNLTTALQRQKANALAASTASAVDNITTITDTKNQENLDKLKSDVLNQLDAIDAAVESGTIASADGQKKKEILLSTKLNVDGLEATFKDLLDPAALEALFQNELENIQRLSKKSIDIKTNQLDILQQLQERGIKTESEAAKQSAALQEQIDQERLKAQTDTVKKLAEKGTGTEAYQQAARELELLEEQVNTNRLKRGQQLTTALAGEELKRQEVILQTTNLQKDQGKLSNLEAIKAQSEAELAIEETKLKEKKANIAEILKQEGVSAERRKQLELEVTTQELSLQKKRFDVQKALVEAQSEQEIKLGETRLKSAQLLELEGGTDKISALKSQYAEENNLDAIRLKAKRDATNFILKQEGVSVEGRKQLQNELLSFELDIEKQRLERRRAFATALFEETSKGVERESQTLVQSVNREISKKDIQSSTADLVSKQEQDKQKLFKATADLEIALLNNRQRVTADLTDKAQIQLDVAKQQAEVAMQEIEFEKTSLDLQIESTRLSLERQQLELSIQKIEGEKQQNLLQQKIESAASLGIRGEDLKLLELELQAQKDKNSVTNLQVGILQRSSSQQIQSLENEKKILNIRAEINKESASLDLAQAERDFKLAALEEESQKVSLLAQKQDLIGQKAITNLEMRSKILEQQNQVIEEQKQILDSVTANQEKLFSIAAGTATTEFRRRRIEKEAAITRLRNLERVQKIETSIFELQEKQKEIANQRSIIEAQIAVTKQKAEIARTKAEQAKTEADPLATKEQKEAARLATEAAQQTLVANEQNLTLTQSQAKIDLTNQKLRRQQLQDSQSTNLLDARSQVASTTLKRSDDRAVGREALSQARGANLDLNGILKQVNTQLQVSSQVLQGVSKPDNSPNTLEGAVKLDLNVNVTGEGAGKIDQESLKKPVEDIVYEGIYQLFSDYKKGL